MGHAALGLLSLVPHRFYPITRQERVAHLLDDGLVLYIHMRHLVIGDGKSLTCPWVQHLQPALIANAEPAALTEHAIDVHGLSDRSDAIFGQHHDPPPPTLCFIDEPTAYRVNLLQIASDLWIVGA